MKNFLSFITIFALLFQSCQTLKPISMNDAIIGKKYEVKMFKGSEITGKLTKVMNDTLIFNINNNGIKLPKNRIEKISQVKIKKKALIIGTIITIGGIIIISKNLPENEDQISVL